MKKFLVKAKAWVISHKFISAIILIVVLFVGHFIYAKLTTTAGDTRYITTKVSRGAIVASVSGSGQVTTTNQIDLKARGTGQITYVGVHAGDKVKKGKTLFSLDARDAEKAVRNAKTSLETAKLELEKFQQPPDTVDVLAIKKAITDAETSKLDAAQKIKDTYRDLLNTGVAAVSSDPANSQTPPTITGTYTKDKEVVITLSVHQTGNSSYFNFTSVPEGVASGLQNVSTVVPQPIGDTGLYVKFATISPNQPDWAITIPNKVASAYNAAYTTYQNAIDDQKKVDDTADLTIAQNNKKLDDLYQPDALTLRSKQLTVKQAEDALLDAQIDLSDYYVTAPFDGTIASVTGKVGDTASGTLGSIITNQKIAEISLNEVDVAKIKTGQKATLTFDAVEGLTISGTVADIDTVGTTSQGVVTYIVKISFDTQDDRVKSAMSVSAAIITDSKQDVLVVPNSAVKSQGGETYVEMFDGALPEPTDGLLGSISTIPPSRQPVEVGLSNDTLTEITSGLKEGDEVVSRTILPTAAKTTAAAPSIFGSSPARATGGTRIQAR